MSEHHHYGYTRRTTLGMAEAITAVTAALKTEGFGVLTTIDVQSTLRQKLNLERNPYLILGACNPQLVSEALEVEPELGLLLPCNVIVYTDANGDTMVSAIDPEVLFTVIRRDDLTALAQEVGVRLQRVLAQLPGVV